MNIPLSSPEASTESTGHLLLEAQRFWAKGRPWFNVIVGAAGMLVVLKSLDLVSLFDSFGIILWGLVANAFYSAGYVLDSFIIVKSRGQKSLKPVRYVLLLLGTLAYAFVSFVFALLYYTLVNAPF